MRKGSAALGSIVFFLLAPGTVTVLIPWWLTRWEAADLPRGWWAAQGIGAVLMAAGAAALIQAFVRFVVEGLGTPAPVAPPSRLVIGGLYRYVRNPMYVSLIAIILGQALWLARWELLAYAAAVWAATATFVRWYEEPVLAKLFGPDYDNYRAAVPAWVPRLRPWTPGP